MRTTLWVTFAAVLTASCATCNSEREAADYYELDGPYLTTWEDQNDSCEEGALTNSGTFSALHTEALKCRFNCEHIQGTDSDLTVVFVNEDGNWAVESTIVVPNDDCAPKSRGRGIWEHSYRTNAMFNDGDDDNNGGTRTCCKVCTTGKACGDTCISASNTCETFGGCACNG